MKALALVLGCSWALITFDKGLQPEPAPLFPPSIKAKVTFMIEETRDERLLRLAHEYAVPESVFRSVYKLETSSGSNIKPKFEPHIVNWLLSDERPKEFRKKVKAFATTKEKMRILASSHGALQVMGYHALDYGIDPEELASNEHLQDLLGMVRLSNAWLASVKEEKNKQKQIALTGKKYNGSWQYAAKLLNDWRKQNV